MGQKPRGYEDHLHATYGAGFGWGRLLPCGQSGKRQAEVFHKGGDYHAFVKLLRASRERVPKRVIAYCTMPKHCHAARSCRLTEIRAAGCNGSSPEKVIDVVGLYLNPPEHALVLCADEKTSVQALDRTQPGLPLVKGRLGTMPHDYKRNGTTTLFAALDMTEGRIIGTCMDRHRHQEWIKFLTLVDQQTPQDLDLHLIVDDYTTHKHPKVKMWLKRHRRFHLHFVPIASSWLNLVERWFRDLTDKRIRRGVFKSVPDSIGAIETYIDHHNTEPKPFVWTAKAEDIIAKYRRAKAVLDNVQTA